MVGLTKRSMRPVHVVVVRAHFDSRERGITYVRSTDPLREYPARVTDRLEHWAQTAPDRIFLAQRTSGGAWETTTYSQALHRVQPVAHLLLR